ncbi:hypothetical protein [Actinophytocola glycyrrhizae]|uniref:Uncharacterized protein n=1 Tax=Actinophytocola glycyrrhizae TaxID=2044873 RepID=A0ABV9SAJ3_9PSEU
MIPSTMTRFAAWSGVLAGLCIGLPGVVEVFTGETALTSLVLGVAPALAVPLLVVLHLRQSDTAGRLGAVGYAMNIIGLGLFGGAGFSLNVVLFHLDTPVVKELLSGPPRFALLGSAVVFAAGTILFGIAMARAGVHPRVPAVAYAVALPVLALAAPLPDSPFISAIHGVAGAAVAWLAVSLGARVPALSGR